MKVKVDSAITFSKKSHSCHYYLEKVYRPYDHTTIKEVGFITPRLAYMLKGSCTIYLPDGEVLDCPENSVWFLPKHKPYKAVWRANGYISFYVIEFDMDFISELLPSHQVLKDTGTLPLFNAIFKSREDGDDVKVLKNFYSLLDVILPLIKKDESKKIDSILPALNFLKENYVLPIKVEDLAKMCYMSQSRFYQVFKETTNTSPIDYKNAIKLADAVNMIQKGLSLEQICERLNFSSPAFLRRLLKKHYNKTPKELKKERLHI
jgi:AraC-like DNA-binding protein